MLPWTSAATPREGNLLSPDGFLMPSPTYASRLSGAGLRQRWIKVLRGKETDFQCLGTVPLAQPGSTACQTAVLLDFGAFMQFRFQCGIGAA